ncbi:MAG: response regulator transcription factor [Bifidobacteriaceae bacterium]|jgi:DNA-binding NarL/FixJ family response regulator|nr:response regulator transcription factor [Bifidobacteriaceae bacterium]
MEPIRVVLVDDQQLVRAGFALVIDSQPDMAVVGQAGDGDQAVRLVAATPCDIVLMDVRMPGTDGLAATTRLAATPPAPGSDAQPRIIMLTTFDLDEYLMAAIKAGASGFLLKDAPPEDMLQAIRTVHGGEAVIAPSSTRRLLDRIAAQAPVAAPGADHRLDQLTDREREVLALMARGLANAEIADRLVVSEATVKTHVSRILAKTGSRDRVQAVVAAFESGFVRP